MRDPKTTISEQEFDALPPALRRKYFSSLERLRLVRDGLSSIAATQHERPLSSSNSKRLKSHPHTGRVLPFQRPPTSFGSNPVSRQRPRSVSASHSLDSEAAAWFASLPPAIQKKQFTLQERFFLASHRDHVLLDAADEAFYRRGGRVSARLEGVPISTSGKDHDKSDSEEENTIDLLPDLPVEMDEEMSDDFRWLDEDSELDLRLDDYHTILRETAAQPLGDPRTRPSFRRHLSLSALPFRRTSVSSSQGTGSGAHTPAQSRPLSSVVAPKHHRPQNSISSIDPRARHYQDPEARLKLRVYLASPQKFDEAIEFGFPSMDDKLHFARPKTSPRMTLESGRTFFTDDTPSLLADEEEREADGDQEDIRDPRTPEEALFRTNRTAQPPAPDTSETARYRLVRGSIEPYAHGPAATREMTLHMTLTRPDLRTADQLQATNKINDKPLEHATLAVSDGPQSIWDTLPTEESRMKKIWKKLRHKGTFT